MHAALVIPLILLCVLAFANLAYYAMVFLRVLHVERTIPTARDGLALPEPEGGWPSVCVVIPAHNEADVIEHSARSLVAQEYPELRVVYSLDRCTDGTERVLREIIGGDERFTVHTITECPDDWAGKTNAIWRAVKQTDAAGASDMLLFTDADTEFDPRLVRATVALLLERGVGMLSLLPRLTFETKFEQAYQPAAAFELGRQFPLDQVNDPGDTPRHFANGQFMLFTRDAYEAVGGHEGVKDELLEDLAFATMLSPRLANKRVACLLSDGMLTCRMYRSEEAFRKGWKRIYTEAAKRKAKRLLGLGNRVLVTGALLPLVSMLALVSGVVAVAFDRPLGAALILTGGFSWGVTVATLARIYRTQGAPLGLIAAYPFGAVFVAGLLREAARDLARGVETEWGGRRYAREVRD